MVSERKNREKKIETGTGDEKAEEDAPREDPVSTPNRIRPGSTSSEPTRKRSGALKGKDQPQSSWK